MKCTICKTGETSPDRVTVTLQRGESIVVVKDVPAEVCDDCGEYYLNDAVAERVYALADGALERHHEVEIVRYAA